MWAVGANGTAVHSNGNGSWQRVETNTTKALTGVFALDATHVFVVGQDGTALDYDGADWALRATSTTATLQAVWAAAPDDAWAVGREGNALHWDGTTWTKVDVGATERLRSVWGANAADVWIGGTNVLLHYDGTTWARTALQSGVAISGLWGSSSSDVWAVGGSWLGINGSELDNVDSEYFTHWNGTTWTASAATVSGPCYAVGGTSASDVWFAGHAGGLGHYEGQSWISQKSTDTFRGLAAAGGSVWMVGVSGRILRVQR